MKNNRSYTIIVAILCGIAAMVSCKKEKNTDMAISFSKDIIPVFTASCALNSGCHAGAINDGDDIDLDGAAAYTTLISKKLVKTDNPTASLLYVEISSGTMPKTPYPHLAAADINKVLNWIKQGAKNN